MCAAPVERDSLFWTLRHQTVKPAAMQVLDPEASGSGPVSARCLGSPSRCRLNGSPSGACPHPQACGPEGSRRCRERQHGRQAGEVRLGGSDAGALQEQDAACHQIGDAQTEEQHLSPLQEALQLVEGRCHSHTVYSHLSGKPFHGLGAGRRICNLFTTS